MEDVAAAGGVHCLNREGRLMAWSFWLACVQVIAPAGAAGDRHERALPDPQRTCGLGRPSACSPLAGKLIRHDQVIDQGQ